MIVSGDPVLIDQVKLTLLFLELTRLKLLLLQQISFFEQTNLVYCQLAILECERERESDKSSFVVDLHF